MKAILSIAAACCALAACSQRETTTAPEAAETVTAAATPTAAAAVLAADGKSPVGKYRLTTADGKVIDEELRADGTYTETSGGKVVGTGRWVQKDGGTYCYTEDKEGAAEVCNTEQVKDGVWTSVNPEGKTVTIVRIDG